jgi:hypothetical protein
MTDQSFDEQGEAHEAMGSVVSSYGARVLSNPQMLRNLVADLLPDLPRERSLLVSAAEAGVAAEMTQYVEEQHIDAATAVQLTARALSERTMIDSTASMWVTTEFAQALGYPARPVSGPAAGGAAGGGLGAAGAAAAAAAGLAAAGPPTQAADIPARPEPAPPLAGFSPPSTSSPQYQETMTAGHDQDAAASSPEPGAPYGIQPGGDGPVSDQQWPAPGATARDQGQPAWGGQGASDQGQPAWGGQGASDQGQAAWGGQSGPVQDGIPSLPDPGHGDIPSLPDPGPQGWGGQGASVPDQGQPAAWGGPGAAMPDPGPQGWGGQGASVPDQGQQPGWGGPGTPGPDQGQAAWGAPGASAPGQGGQGQAGWGASAPPPGGWPASGAPAGGAQGWPASGAPAGGGTGWSGQNATAPIAGSPGWAAQGGTAPVGGSPGWTGPGGPYQPPKPPRNRGPLIAILAAAGVLILYFAIIAPVAGIFPFGGGSPKPKPSHSPVVAQSSVPATPAPSPTPDLAAGVASLTQLLPADIDQPDTECQAMKAPYHWTNPGLVQALSCNDPGLSGGTVYAYQMDSAADFAAAFQNFNKWWGFDFSTAGTNCPPAAGGQGTIGWNDKYFPQRSNQSLECSMVGSGSGAGPAYAYAYPTQDAFILAQAAPGTTFKALDTWWTNNGGPAASPSPATP